MMKVEEVIATLRNNFQFEDKRPERDYHVITCKKCKARWSLGINNGDDIASGNVLALMNHAGAHILMD